MPPLFAGVPPAVSYGDWEPDPDAAPVYGGDMVGRRITLYPSTGGWRRRRYERWVTAKGEHMGRWTWERRPAWAMSKAHDVS